MDYSSNTTVNTAGLESLVAKAVDTVTTYSPTTLFFLGNQKQWTGTRMGFPIKYQKNAQGTWFTGLEKFSTTKTQNFINMNFDPTAREIPCVISQLEVDIADTNRVVDLVARQLASDAQDMASDVADSFFTIQSGNSFLSLLDAVDDGSELGVTTYGGLSRSTYTGLAGNVTSSIGNVTLANIRTEFNNATHGKDSPNLFITTKAVWGYIEKLATPTVQHNFTTSQGYASFVGATAGGLPNITAPGQKAAGNLGFHAIYWQGIPVIADESCPTGYLFMLNTRNIAFYGVKTKDPDYKTVQFTSDTLDGAYNVPVTTGFSFSGFNKPIDQYGKVGHIILAGNLICDAPRNQALLTGITGS